MNCKRAFTLVELLGCVAVIVVLAAIAIPTVQNMVVESQRHALKAELQRLNSAAQQYVGAGGVLPNTTNGAINALKTPITFGGGTLGPFLSGDPELSRTIGEDTLQLG